MELSLEEFEDIDRTASLEKYLYDAEERIESLNADKFIELLADKLSWAFSLDTLKLITVDVFDTLLIRSDESEIKRFLMIAESQSLYLNEKYNRELSKYDLLAARLSGTKISYRASQVIDGCREGNISDIYSVACEALDVPYDETSALIDIELSIEKKLLSLNQKLLECLVNFKEKGVKLILISDMYLRKKEISELLEHFIPQWDNYFSELISSADVTVTKASGKIFDMVAEIHNMSPDSWAHMGDALLGDFTSPRKKGIYGIYLPISKRSLSARKACEESSLKELEPQGLNFRKFNT